MTEEKDAKARLAATANRWLGERMVAVATLLFLIVSMTLEVAGTTTKAWAMVKSAFSERISVLSAEETEILDEWVLRIDTAESFAQANVYRENVRAAARLIQDQEVREHFSRNLRVVRDNGNVGYWLLVADITGGRSSKGEVTATMECLWETVRSWESDDSMSPWLRVAKPLEYTLEAFQSSYGRAINIPVDHESPSLPAIEVDNLPCVSPYTKIRTEA